LFPVVVFNATVTSIVDGPQGWVKYKDVDGAALAVITLWRIYDLDLDLYLDGVLKHTRSDPLTPEDIAYITKVAYDADNRCDRMYDVITWLEKLIERLHAGTMVDKAAPPVDMTAVYSRLAQGYKKVMFLKHISQKY
jgi:hypothetical protein